jgi:hypothetical protein
MLTQDRAEPFRQENRKPKGRDRVQKADSDRVEQKMNERDRHR